MSIDRVIVKYDVLLRMANNSINSAISMLHAKQTNASSQDVYLYQEIFDAILGQRLLPATKLPEDELVQLFSVSRSVVRRALQSLSHDGIVDITPNKGATVARPSIKEAKEILAARQLIELAIVREAVTAITPEGVLQLKACVELERACFQNNERGTGIRLSGDFHLKLALLTGNSTLIKFVKSLIPLTSLIIALYERPGNGSCSSHEHFQLIDMIASGDANLAEKMMLAHLQHIERKLDLTDETFRSDLSKVFSHVNLDKKTAKKSNA